MKSLFIQTHFNQHVIGNVFEISLKHFLKTELLYPYGDRLTKIYQFNVVYYIIVCIIFLSFCLPKYFSLRDRCDQSFARLTPKTLNYVSHKIINILCEEITFR